MSHRTSAFCVFMAVLALSSIGCASDPSSPSGGATPQLTAPALDTPTDDEQLTTLRPTLVVRNGSSNQNGTRTYEFQVSTSSSFATVALSRGGVAENASGRTSFVADSDLQSTTRYYWRSRVSQGSSNSEWTAVGRFRTKAVGYNNPRELFDPLVAGETIGTVFGAHTWMSGRGSAAHQPDLLRPVRPARHGRRRRIFDGDQGRRTGGTHGQATTVLDAERHRPS